MPKFVAALTGLFLSLILSGCGLFSASKPHVEIYSPNGEPLEGGALGHPACPDALDAWFDRVDRNHDGVVDLTEYLADARRQFAAMDLDRDGVLTPDVLARYRAPYQVSGRMGAGGDGTAGSEHRSGLSALFGHSDHANAYASPRADQPDPVMAADVRLRFEVRLPDFLSYERQHFAAMDSEGAGRLSKADVEAGCT